MVNNGVKPGYDENGEPLVKGPVASVGVAVHATTSGNWDLAERMEKAMSEEVQRSYDEGVTDPVQVRERIHAVRDRMAEEHFRAREAESKAATG